MPIDAAVLSTGLQDRVIVRRSRTIRQRHWCWVASAVVPGCAPPSVRHRAGDGAPNALAGRLVHCCGRKEAQQRAGLQAVLPLADVLGVVELLARKGKLGVAES